MMTGTVFVVSSPENYLNIEWDKKSYGMVLAVSCCCGIPTEEEEVVLLGFNSILLLFFLPVKKSYAGVLHTYSSIRPKMKLE